MKTKTIVTESPEDMDRICNEFNKEHTVKFTQTDMAVACVGDSIMCKHKSTMFYEDSTP